MSAKAPRPPELPGFPKPGFCDAARIIGWAGRGFAHSVKYGAPVDKAWGGVFALVWAALLPVSPVIQWLLIQRPNARYYMSPQRDAVLALVVRGNAWDVSDHSAQRIGTGAGRRLRAALLPALLPAATAAGVSLTLTAATRGLAARYAADVPGLVDVGPGIPRGRKMRRP